MGVSAGALTPSSGGAGEDGLSKAEPGGRSGAGHVIEAGPILWSAEAAGKDAGNDGVRGARQHDGSGGSANLVIDNREAVALAGQAQHGEQKVVAVRTVDPTGAKDEIFAADVCDGLFAGQLAGAVDVQWIGRVGFNPRLRLAAIEDVVGGVVNKERVTLKRLFGEDARRLLVDGVGEIALRFGAIDGSVGGSVENEIGRGAANQSAGLIGIG